MKRFEFTEQLLSAIRRESTIKGIITKESSTNNKTMRSILLFLECFIREVTESDLEILEPELIHECDKVDDCTSYALALIQTMVNKPRYLNYVFNSRFTKSLQTLLKGGYLVE